MARIGIPSQVFPGIKLISELSESKMNSLVDYLKSLPIEAGFDVVASELSSLLEIKNGTLLLQTITSFSNLIDEDESENKLIAQNLTESYIESSGDELTSERQIILSNYLYQIIRNYGPIKFILNSRKLYSENENIVRDINLITDLRLVFKEDIEDKNRAAIILHKLYFEYRKGDNTRELHLTLDIEDLNKLKLEIEKAIQKDQILRDDYKETLKFIF